MKLYNVLSIPNLLLLLLASLNITAHISLYDTAVIKDPIAEMNSSFPAPNNPSVSPEEKSCRRAHQGLFNEIIDCIEQNGEQVKISYHNIIYGFDADTKKALSSFWTYKKHLASVKELETDILQTIPNRNYAQEPTIVLIYPWQKFSVGTRFKHIPEYDTPTAFSITRADYQTNTPVFDLVPHQDAIQEIKQDEQSARKLFVKIINDLIDRVTASGPDNVIPYVWGGSSFVHTYKQSDFYQKDGTWHRIGNTDPYTGYDCSEFVMRMAQIAGIDFPWKTTIAIQLSTRELNDTDQLQDGDLIWVQGHIMIISNIERNELIESRSYQSGYGSVHRITLDKCFDGIATYDDLLEHYYSNKTIKFKDKQGKVTQKANAFKLLKLIH